MKRTVILWTIGAALTLWTMAPVGAQSFVTEPEAQAMLEKAVAALKANEAEALANFSRRDTGFFDRDLYVLCFNMSDGKIRSHINTTLIGTDIRTVKGPDGSALGQKIFNAVPKSDYPFAKFSYDFPKTTGGTPVPWEIFLARVHDLGCGTSYFVSN